MGLVPEVLVIVVLDDSGPHETDHLGNPIVDRTGDLIAQEPRNLGERHPVIPRVFVFLDELHASVRYLQTDPTD